LILIPSITTATIPPHDACLNPNDDPTTLHTEWFPTITSIQYEGPSSTNPLSYKYYNPDEVIMGKKMKDWLKFSLAFWHTMRGDGSDPFGSPTKSWPWEEGASSLDPVIMAKRRLRVFFEIVKKLGVEYWCFHDRDISPEGSSLQESNRMMDDIVQYAKVEQEKAGARVLWGTAQLFKHPRYAQGGATSPNATVFAHAAAQVTKAMEATKYLGGDGYVFWGGREGYSTLLNTDLKLELDNLARFMKMAVQYAKSIGFTGQLLLEPKPQEPTKHQYDYDVSTTSAFLLRYGLQDHFKINVECNHATLSGHSCQHELQMASIYGMLGSLDANSGDPQTGWDTDQFLTDPKEATLVAAVILKQGGLAGGVNFDAKLRRESTDPLDLFYGHIGGIDALARGLRNAARMIEEGVMDGMVEERYSSWRETELGREIVGEKIGFKELAAAAVVVGGEEKEEEGVKSGREELFEMWLNRYVV
jgi:xylose isomerase